MSQIEKLWEKIMDGDELRTGAIEGIKQGEAASSLIMLAALLQPLCNFMVRHSRMGYLGALGSEG